MYDKNDNEVLAGGCFILIIAMLLIPSCTFIVMKELGYERSNAKCFFCGQKIEVEQNEH